MTPYHFWSSTCAQGTEKIGSVGAINTPLLLWPEFSQPWLYFVGNVTWLGGNSQTLSYIGITVMLISESFLFFTQVLWVPALSILLMEDFTFAPGSTCWWCHVFCYEKTISSDLCGKMCLIDLLLDQELWNHLTAQAFSLPTLSFSAAHLSVFTYSQLSPRLG